MIRRRILNPSGNCNEYNKGVNFFNKTIIAALLNILEDCYAYQHALYSTQLVKWSISPMLRLLSRMHGGLSVSIEMTTEDGGEISLGRCANMQLVCRITCRYCQVSQLSSLD